MPPIFGSFIPGFRTRRVAAARKRRALHLAMLSLEERSLMTTIIPYVPDAGSNPPICTANISQTSQYVLTGKLTGQINSNSSQSEEFQVTIHLPKMVSTASVCLDPTTDKSISALFDFGDGPGVSTGPALVNEKALTAIHGFDDTYPNFSTPVVLQSDTSINTISFKMYVQDTNFSSQLPVTVSYNIDIDVQAAPQSPDLVMNSAAISSNGQTATANYAITGSNLPTAGTIDFYWASGPSLSNKLGNAVPVSTATAVGSYTASLPLSKLGSRPANADFILAVATSPNADPVHNVSSAKLIKTLQPISASTGEAIEQKAVQVVANYKARGVTYLLGGNAANGGKTSDCTHFISDVLNQAGLTVPYTSTAQFPSSTYYEVVPASQARAGDIMVQGAHAGIFTGTFDAKGHPLGAEMGNNGPVVFAPWGMGGWFAQPTTLTYYRLLQLQLRSVSNYGVSVSRLPLTIFLK